VHSALNPNVRRNHFARNDHSQQNQNQVVEVAENGNEVRYQIDWADDIGNEQCDEDPGIPRRGRVTHGADHNGDVSLKFGRLVSTPTEK